MNRLRSTLIALFFVALVGLAGCGHRVTSGQIIQKQIIPAHLNYGQTRYCASTATRRTANYSYRNGKRYLTGYSFSTYCAIYAVRSYSYMVDTTWGFRLRDGHNRLGYVYVSPYTFDRYHEGQQFP